VISNFSRKSKKKFFLLLTPSGKTVLKKKIEQYLQTAVTQHSLKLFDNFGRSKRRLDMRLETKREAEGKSKNLEGKVEHKIGEVKAVVGK
jgi:hypothetical protein